MLMCINLWILAVLSFPIVVNAGPIEEVNCPSPSVSGEHVEVYMLCQRFNCSASFRCEQGYKYKGTSQIFCQQDNTWTHAHGTCEVIRCPKLPAPQNGRTLQQNRTYKATVRTVCDDGYVPAVHETITRECQGNSTWSGEAVICTRKQCPDILEIENGILSTVSGRYGDKITLQCNSGYTMDGVNTITCRASGKWDAKIGKCNSQGTVLENMQWAITVVLILAVGIVIFIVISCRKRRLRVVEDVATGPKWHVPEPEEDLPIALEIVDEFIESPPPELYVNCAQGPYQLIDPKEIQNPSPLPEQAVQKKDEAEIEQNKVVPQRRRRDTPPAPLPRAAKKKPSIHSDYLIMEEDAPKPEESPYLKPRQHNIQPAVKDN